MEKVVESRREERREGRRVDRRERWWSWRFKELVPPLVGGGEGEREGEEWKWVI